MSLTDLFLKEWQWDDSLALSIAIAKAKKRSYTELAVDYAKMIFYLIFETGHPVEAWDYFLNIVMSVFESYEANTDLISIEHERLKAKVNMWLETFKQFSGEQTATGIGG